MKKFYVMWTYIANFGGPYERWADTPQAAAESVRQGFSKDFRDKGTVYVFDAAPVLVVKGDKVTG
jgi:hypothetical protein